MFPHKILAAVVVVALLAVGCTDENNPIAPNSLEDSTPPSIPVSLVATGTQLSWQSNGESDLAGYHVYRYNPSPDRELAYERMNSSLVTSNTYQVPSTSDEQTYRISAVDINGNESALSSAVIVSPALGGGYADDTPIKRGR